MTHRYTIPEFRRVEQALLEYYHALQQVATQVRLHRDTTSAMEELTAKRQELREAIAALKLDDELYQPNSLEIQL